MWRRYASFSKLLVTVAFCAVAMAGCTGLGQQIFVGATDPPPCSQITPDQVQVALRALDRVAVSFEFETYNVAAFSDGRLAYYRRYLGMFQKSRHHLNGSHADMILGADLSPDRCTFRVGFVDESNSGETEFSRALRAALVAELSQALPDREIRHDTWDKTLF